MALRSILRKTAVIIPFMLLPLLTAAWAQEGDPPSIVGRVSFIEGTVLQYTPDSTDWTDASVNYPVTSGFSIATQEGGRAEFEVSSIGVRLAGDSEVDVTQLDNGQAAMTVARGEANIRVGRLGGGSVITIATPRGLVDLVAAGSYHIDSGSTDDPTRIAVFSGHAVLRQDSGPVDITAGNAALVGGDPANPQVSFDQTSTDPLDDWAHEREERENRLAAGNARANYYSPGMTGAEDLDSYGSWQDAPEYGHVWYPQGVAEDWAPYRYGHWGFVAPWGWTWIDDAPWGFAPFHYGRWVDVDGRWGWTPGVVVAQAVYAPALVAFVNTGGLGISIGIGAVAPVAWVPLGPQEVFVPYYHTSENYVRQVNVTNVTNINNVNITNIVNNNNTTNTHFVNQRFATVVPHDAFAGGRPVAVAAKATPPEVRQAVETRAALPVSRTPPVTAQERPRPTPAAAATAAKLPPPAVHRNAPIPSLAPRGNPQGGQRPENAVNRPGNAPGGNFQGNRPSVPGNGPVNKGPVNNGPVNNGPANNTERRPGEPPNAQFNRPQSPNGPPQGGAQRPGLPGLPGSAGGQRNPPEGNLPPPPQARTPQGEPNRQLQENRPNAPGIQGERNPGAPGNPTRPAEQFHPQTPPAEQAHPQNRPAEQFHPQTPPRPEAPQPQQFHPPAPPQHENQPQRPQNFESRPQPQQNMQINHPAPPARPEAPKPPPPPKENEKKPGQENQHQ